jgi:hypothetical protein
LRGVRANSPAGTPARGDLLMRLRVQVAERPSAEERAFYERLRALATRSV